MQNIPPEPSPQQAILQFLTPLIDKYKIEVKSQPDQQTLFLVFDNKIIAAIHENGWLILPAPWPDLPTIPMSINEINIRTVAINNYLFAMTRTTEQRSQYISALNRRLHDEESLYETSACYGCDWSHRPFINIEYKMQPKGSHSGFATYLHIYSSWNRLSIDTQIAKEFTKQAEQELDQINMRNVRISG